MHVGRKLHEIPGIDKILLDSTPAFESAENKSAAYASLSWMPANLRH